MTAYLQLRLNIVMTCFALMIALVILILISPIMAAENGEQDPSIIKIASLDDFPPQYFLDKTGKATGFAIDIMNEVADIAGLKPEYIIFKTWDEVQLALKNGTVDVIPNMGITERRKEFADFTLPVETFPVSIFVRSSETEIKSAKDLTGKRVTVVKVNIGYVLLKDNKSINLNYAVNAQEAMMLLLSGYTDAVVYPRPVIESLALKSGLSDRMKVAGEPLEEVSRGIAISKGRTELFNTLNNAVSDLITSNDYKEIYARWYGGIDEGWTTKHLSLSLGLLVASFLAGLILIRYQSLAKFSKELKSRIVERTRQLKESEENARLLFETSFLGIAEHKLIYDDRGLPKDYTISNVNPAYYHILDFITDTVEGKKASEVYGTGEAPFLEEYSLIARGGPPTELELNFESLNRIFRIFAYSHKSDSFVTVFEDITERKEAESREKGYNRFISSLLSAIPIPVFYKDRKGYYIGCNTAFTEMMGPTSEEIKGKTVYDMAPKEIAEVYHQKDLDLMANPENQMYEFKIKDKNGITRPVIFAKDVFYDDQGNVAGLIGTFLDITDRRNAELALQKKEEKYRILASELSRANEELSQYAFVVSHDLKTPLRAIHNYSTFIAEDMSGLDLPETVRQDLKGLSKAVKQCQGLVDDLLEFSRIGRINSDLEILNLKNILDEVLEGISLPAMARIIFNNDLPCVKANSILLKQVLTNLITNGIKFNNSPEILIEISGKQISESTVEIMIRDNGIGIDEKYHQQIFQVFQRLHTRSEYEGSGVGLAIVKKGVEIMGGSVRLESTPGKGTIFFVSLQAPSEAET